jgi:hypothetical protein
MSSKSITSFGVVPLILLAVGLFWRNARYSRALLILGGLWGLANVLFEIREVHATVTAEDPIISVVTGAP